MKADKKELIIISSALGFLFILAVLGIYDCPLDRIFGIPCPLCGITRAFVSLIKADIPSAFFYHPLWPVIAVYAILYLLYLSGRITPSKKMIDITGWILSFLLIACYIIRHIKGSPVVQIHFDTSLIYRLFRLIKNAMT